MRDVKRIDGFLEKFGEMWKTHFPDWRFGQLVVNFERAYGDPFYLEEDDFLKKLAEFCEKFSPLE